MSYTFGGKSLNMLTGVHPNMVAVIQASLSTGIMDFTVLEGMRTIEREKLLFETGATKTLKSKHLMHPDGYGHAVDIAPFPINYKDHGSFYILNGIIRATANKLGIPIRTGCDWDLDGQTLDQTFNDLGHYELL